MYFCKSINNYSVMNTMNLCFGFQVLMLIALDPISLVVGGLKDQIPWKVKASILCSERAYPGVLRSLAINNNECTVFTGRVGPGFKGSVQKWELPRRQCVSGYYGHDKVVNSVCILSTTGRVPSCDGEIHVWNGQTGKLIAAYSESASNLLQHGVPLATKLTTYQSSMLSSNVLSGGVLSNALSGILYTCMHDASLII